MHTYCWSDRHIYAIVVLCCILLTLEAQNIPFFWDNVLLASKIAHFYYENHFSTLILPNIIDSGHPPFYGLYLAGVWQCWGKSLVSSHWAILPFWVGMGITYYRLLCYCLPPKYAFIGLLFLLAEPAIFTQSLLASIDIPIVWAHLLLLQGLLYKQRKLVFLGSLFLCMFSIRGIITAATLGLCDVLLCFYRGERCIRIVLKNTLPAWLPAICMTLAWYTYHYVQTGFWVLNYQSSWALAPDNLYYRYTNLNTFLYNIAIIGWRFLDQGRIVIWVLLGYIFYKKQQNNSPLTRQQIEWLIVCFLPLIIVVTIIAARHNPIMPRYFLTYFLLLPATAIYSLVGEKLSKIGQNVQEYTKAKKQFLITIAIFVIALLSGHFWLYPYPIANSWDTTLRCLAYFEVQQQLYNYACSQNIPFVQIGSAFPLFTAQKYTNLDKDDERTFTDKVKYPQKDFAYFCLSNCSNEFKPTEIKTLQKSPWQLLKRFESKGIWIELYKQQQN